MFRWLKSRWMKFSAREGQNYNVMLRVNSKWDHTFGCRLISKIGWKLYNTPVDATAPSILYCHMLFDCIFVLYVCNALLPVFGTSKWRIYVMTFNVRCRICTALSTIIHPLYGDGLFALSLSFSLALFGLIAPIHSFYRYSVLFDTFKPIKLCAACWDFVQQPFSRFIQLKKYALYIDVAKHVRKHEPKVTKNERK